MGEKVKIDNKEYIVDDNFFVLMKVLNQLALALDKLERKL